MIARKPKETKRRRASGLMASKLLNASLASTRFTTYLLRHFFSEVPAIQKARYFLGLYPTSACSMRSRAAS
jgi:hypothetical protein